jgi:5-methylcytosine-specific restriction enzyme A
MKRPCSYPGCPALLDKTGYCERHKASAPKRHKLYDKHVRQRDPVLATAARIRASRRWKQVQRLVLSDNPTCADPYGDHQRAGITRTSKQVHHIKGLAEHPELAFHADKVMALCTACHARIEREHRAAVAASPKQSSRKAGGTQIDGGEGQKFNPFG